jgi:hypothetical protein
MKELAAAAFEAAEYLGLDKPAVTAEDLGGFTLSGTLTDACGTRVGRVSININLHGEK